MFTLEQENRVFKIHFFITFLSICRINIRVSRQYS